MGEHASTVGSLATTGETAPRLLQLLGASAKPYPLNADDVCVGAVSSTCDDNALLARPPNIFVPMFNPDVTLM